MSIAGLPANVVPRLFSPFNPNVQLSIIFIISVKAHLVRKPLPIKTGSSKERILARKNTSTDCKVYRNIINISSFIVRLRQKCFMFSSWFCVNNLWSVRLEWTMRLEWTSPLPRLRCRSYRLLQILNEPHYSCKGQCFYTFIFTSRRQLALSPVAINRGFQEFTAGLHKTLVK